MGCCCSEFVTLGCVNFCDQIDTTYNAIQNGIHTLETYVVNGSVYDISLGTLLIGDDLLIPANTLNESRDHDIRIKQPDGTYYAFTATIDCLRLTTQIHYSEDDIIT